MPLIALRCIEGHESEQFVHHTDDTGCETRICHCGNTLAPALSMGRGLTWFEEGRPFLMQHGVPEPVLITSHEQHKRVMKEHGLEPAYHWTQTRST